MKKLEKILFYAIIAVLFLFNTYFLILNKNKSDSLNLSINENVKLKQIISNNQLDFSQMLGMHYSFLDAEINKKIIFYIPQTACGICLEKLFNKYWDKYFERISGQILFIYEDKNVKSIYYLSENLVESKLIEPIRGHGNNKTIIYFNLGNRLFYPVKFDLSIINYVEPYFTSFSSTKE